MGCWIFQGNPQRFDVDTYLKEAFAKDRIIYWSIMQRKYINEIKTGDEIFIWRSDGNVRYSGGIVAKGIVIAEPIFMEDDERSISLWSSYPGKGYRAKIFLEDVRLSVEEGMIPRLQIEEDDILKNLGIVKFRQLTNYPVDENMANRIRFLWVLRKIEILGGNL